jgi:hypothetical protein
VPQGAARKNVRIAASCWQASQESEQLFVNRSASSWELQQERAPNYEKRTIGYPIPRTEPRFAAVSHVLLALNRTIVCV